MLSFFVLHKMAENLPSVSDPPLLQSMLGKNFGVQHFELFFLLFPDTRA